MTMNEESIIKILSAPGAIVVLMLWLNSRLAHVERCIECIAASGGITLPKRKVKPLKSVLPILAATGLMLLSGCASVHQVATKTDGSKVESTVLALWPATSALDKGSVKQTAATQGIGTEGAAAEGGGTNVVTALSELRQILQTISRP
jgi:hypothetical protein